MRSLGFCWYLLAVSRSGPGDGTPDAAPPDAELADAAPSDAALCPVELAEPPPTTGQGTEECPRTANGCPEGCAAIDGALLVTEPPCACLAQVDGPVVCQQGDFVNNAVWCGVFISTGQVFQLDEGEPPQEPYYDGWRLCTAEEEAAVNAAERCP